jgi:hypothetical protein
VKPLKRKSIKNEKKKRLASFLAVNYLLIRSDYTRTHRILKPNTFSQASGDLRDTSPIYSPSTRFIARNSPLEQGHYLAHCCTAPTSTYTLVAEDVSPFLAIIVATHTHHFRAACYIRE